MKKVFLALIFAATSMVAFAQKPASGDHSFSFGVTGLSNLGVAAPHFTGTLLFRHYISDNMAARVGLNLSTTSNKYSAMNDSIKFNSSSTSWAISLGVQHDFTGTEKLEPYIGVDLVLGGGSSKGDSTWMTGLGTTADTYKGGSTFRFGLVPCVGFNYYFTDWFAIGAEFGYGFTSTSTGEGTYTSSFTSGSTTTTISSKTGKSGTSGLGTIGSGMVTVTVAFH